MNKPPKLTWLQRISSSQSQGQFLRYLMVGAWNTAFGYSTFAALNWLFYRRHVAASYIYAQVISSFINITVAYFGYKFFVFRTKGNYFKEWLKAMAVAWSAFPVGIFVLAASVRIVNWILPLQFTLFHHLFITKVAAPYIGSAATLVLNVIYNFFGHKNVTFRRERPAVDTSIDTNS